MSKKQRREIPQFGHPIIETHCHLDYLDPDSLAEELAEARRVGVERIITIAVSPDNLAKVRDIAGTHKDIYCTQGIHPHEAESFDSTVGQQIREGIHDHRVLAVGEIGLDYFYDHADRSTQRKVFAEQLAIACDEQLPVVIHSRDADEDMQAMLAEHLPQLHRRGVIHSFSSGLALAEFALDAGFKLGFNGMVTFNKADNVRAAVQITPIEQLILETDAPYLTPAPYRGRPNGPRYLPFIAEKIAELKETDVATLLTTCYRNSEALFFAHREGSAA